MGRNRTKKKNRPPRTGPDPRDALPLPVTEVEGEKHFDIGKMNLHERVRFLLWKTKEQEDAILMLKATADKHRAGLMEANDLVHIVAALVRRACPLTRPDGSPVVDDFLRVVALEHESYASAFMPGIEPSTRQMLEAKSLSHVLQKATKAARLKALDAIRTAHAAAGAAVGPTINPTPDNPSTPKETLT